MEHLYVVSVQLDLLASIRLQGSSSPELEWAYVTLSDVQQELLQEILLAGRARRAGTKSGVGDRGLPAPAETATDGLERPKHGTQAVALTDQDSEPVVDGGGPVPRLIWSAPSSGTTGSPRRTGGRRHSRSPSASLNGWHRPSPAS